MTTEANLCQFGCEVLVSSVADDPLATFVSCMQDGQTDCTSAVGCVLGLPVDLQL